MDNAEPSGPTYSIALESGTGDRVMLGSVAPQATETFEVEGLLHAFRVVRFEGSEGLSELFQFQLTLLCDSDAIAFDDIVGATALMTLHGEGGERHVHGIVSRFEQSETSVQRARQAAYVATLERR